MKLPHLLQYISGRDDPTGYRLKIGVVALAPVSLFAFLVSDLSSRSVGLKVLFGASVVWMVVIFAIGIQQMFGAAFRKNSNG